MKKKAPETSGCTIIVRVTGRCDCSVLFFHNRDIGDQLHVCFNSMRIDAAGNRNLIPAGSYTATDKWELVYYLRWAKGLGMKVPDSVFKKILKFKT